MAREFLLNQKDPMLQHYYDYMTDISVIFGANVTTAPYEMLDVLNFERALANVSIKFKTILFYKLFLNILYSFSHFIKISLAAEDRRDGEAQFNPYTIAEMETMYPHIKWMDYFNALMPKSIKLTHAEVVVVVTPIYFERLAEILAKTSKRTIANYFCWRSFIVSSNFLNDLVRIRKIQYLSAITANGDGQPGQGGTSQWKECISYTTST